MPSANVIDGFADPLTARLPLAASAAGIARERLHQWLRSASLHDDVIADIVLCASELVTNAIVHAHSAPTLQARWPTTQLLQLTVTDQSDQRPVLRAAGTAAGGFGLRVVDSLATSWGWSPTADGKTVWATFDLRSC